MKWSIMFLTILFYAACTKNDPCADERFHCSHTVYYAYTACPDPDAPEKWTFSNCKSFTETEEMTACDTASWLMEARSFDSDRKQDLQSDTWDEFVRQYPNHCGCN